MTQITPKRAILLARVSDARENDNDEDELPSVRDQLARMRQRATALGWGVGREVIEPKVSAYRRRKIVLPGGRTGLRVHRPGFREALDDLADGRADGLMVDDLDRLARDPRDLEDLIDVVEARSPRLPVESVTGSLRLANDGDVTMARVMVAVANKSSRDTARRVAGARLRQASEGRYGGGSRRPYGFESDGINVREAEADEIRTAARGLLDGISLAALTADLRAREVPTVTGKPWSASTLRDILLRPRNAGLLVYRGQILEPGEGVVRAPWEPLIDRESWEAVRALLTDPNRTTSPGNTPRWLGSLIYRCGHPDCAGSDPVATMRVGTSGKRPQPAYRCGQRAHLVRLAQPLDDHVAAVLVARLSQPDAVDLLAARPEVDTRELARQAGALRARITEAGSLWEDGVMSGAEYRARRARLAERLAQVEAELHAAAGSDPLAGLAGNPDAAEVWTSLPLARRRAVLDTMAVVTVMPSTRRSGSRGFDPASVRIEPRQP